MIDPDPFLDDDPFLPGAAPPRRRGAEGDALFWTLLAFAALVLLALLGAP
jgi:hypothetical protein